MEKWTSKSNRASNFASDTPILRSVRPKIMQWRCVSCPHGGRGEYFGGFFSCPHGGRGEYFGDFFSCPNGGRGEHFGGFFSCPHGGREKHFGRQKVYR